MTLEGRLKNCFVCRNQLDATYFIILFVAEHVSAVNTTIFRSLRLIGSYFMGCIWFGVFWRSVSVWLWRCGVFMQRVVLQNHLCGLVVRVSGYRYRGPGFDPRRYQILEGRLKNCFVCRNQLDAIFLFVAQHVSAVNTTIFRSLRLIGSYFMGCIWFGVFWRSVSVWLWRCGVFMQSEAHSHSRLLKMVVLTAETC